MLHLDAQKKMGQRGDDRDSAIHFLIVPTQTSHLAMCKKTSPPQTTPFAGLTVVGYPSSKTQKENTEWRAVLSLRTNSITYRNLENHEPKAKIQHEHPRRKQKVCTPY
jgi:hypothetical protein